MSITSLYKRRAFLMFVGLAAMANFGFAQGDVVNSQNWTYTTLNTISSFVSRTFDNFPVCNVDPLPYPYTGDPQLCRIQNYFISNPEYQKGDIIFLGDSLTDLARAEFNTMFPRVHNYATAGAEIQSVINLLYNPTLRNKLIHPTTRPSELWVLIGGNDLRLANGFTQGVQAKYHTLLMELDFLRAQALALDPSEQLKVVIRAVPPLGDNIWLSLLLTTPANNYLQTQAAAKGFQFVNNTDIFYNSGPVPGMTLNDDPFHVSIDGYRNWLSRLATQVFPHLSAYSSGFVHTLKSPTAAPKSDESLLLAPGAQFRYASITVPANKKVTLSVYNAEYTYAAIFDPTKPNPDNLPVAVAERVVNNNTAQATYRNISGQERTLILCMGMYNGSAYYQISTSNLP